MTETPEQRGEKPPAPGPVDLVGTAYGQAVASGDVPSGTPIGFDPRQINRCRSCNALIWWRVNPSGARQPFDYDVHRRAGTDMPHHATCPQGREWRRRRAATVPVADDA